MLYRRRQKELFLTNWSSCCEAEQNKNCLQSKSVQLSLLESVKIVWFRVESSLLSGCAVAEGCDLFVVLARYIHKRTLYSGAAPLAPWRQTGRNVELIAQSAGGRQESHFYCEIRSKRAAQMYRKWFWSWQFNISKKKIYFFLYRSTVYIVSKL